jgi:hypothetical protein
MADHTTVRARSGFREFFGPHRNTHWIIAGSIAVIILGGYLVYSFDENKPTIVVTIPATLQAQPPAAQAAPVPVPVPEK